MRAFYIQKAFYRYRLRAKFYDTVQRVVAGLRIQRFIRQQFQIVYKLRINLMKRGCARKIQRFYRMFRIWSNPILRQPIEQQPDEDRAVYKRRIVNAALSAQKTRLAVRSYYDKSQDKMVYEPHTLQSFLEAFKLDFDFSDKFTWRIRAIRLNLDQRVFRHISKIIRIVQRFAHSIQGNQRIRMIRLHYQVHRFYVSRVTRRRIAPTGNVIKPFFMAAVSNRIVAARQVIHHATNVLQRVGKNFPEMRRRRDANHRARCEATEMMSEFAVATEREEASKKMQRAWRAYRIKSILRRQRNLAGSPVRRFKDLSGDNERDYAATRIQTAYRRHLCMRTFKQARAAWRFIQIEWKDMWQFMAPVLRVQQKFRQILKRNREFAKHKQRRAQHQAALTIQAVWHASKEVDMEKRRLSLMSENNSNDNDDDFEYSSSSEDEL
jgi:hypothetical protein